MLHEIEGVGQERARVSGRPGIDTEVPLLAHLDVEVEGDTGAYADRLRGLLAAVYDLAVREDFDEEDLPVDTIPTWFAGVCRGGRATEAFAAAGRENYLARTGADAWELHDWLSRFDPELEARGWAFWDVTRPSAGGRRVRLWLDTWGEPFFAWEELRFLAYTCGALSVSDPVLAESSVWAGEPSV